MEVLQTCASADLVCGLLACSFHALRQSSIDFLKVACAAAGTLPLMQVSYLVRKSSHSATPTLSPEAVVPPVESPPPHASMSAPMARHRENSSASFVVIV